MHACMHACACQKGAHWVLARCGEGRAPQLPPQALHLCSLCKGGQGAGSRSSTGLARGPYICSMPLAWKKGRAEPLACAQGSQPHSLGLLDLRRDDLLSLAAWAPVRAAPGCQPRTRALSARAGGTALPGHCTAR